MRQGFSLKLNLPFWSELTTAAVLLQVIAPLLRVLVDLHAVHVLHRDIKPENIFLTAEHKLKLGDMGLAIQNSTELAFTRSGTLDYMAPEVRQQNCQPTATLPCVDNLHESSRCRAPKRVCYDGVR